MTALKIAVLLNGFESPSTPAIKASFTTAVSSATKSSSPVPTIDFYDPIVAQVYPDPAKYDLIVLSGGTADPMGSAPWVLKLQNYLRATVKEFPKQKIVGICWGHQTLSISFGGEVGNMTGPEIGVTRIGLTEEGKNMFPFAAEKGCLVMHEFHRREIKVPVDDFVQLAEGNQVFVNRVNTILTFQGHPELNVGLAQVLLASTPSCMGIDDEKEAMRTSMKSEHDGVQIWKRILEWVKE